VFCGCGLKPLVLGQDRSETKKNRSWSWSWCCEILSCYARRHSNLEGHNNFSSTIYSISYSVLGTSLLWRTTVAFTYLNVKSAKCFFGLVSRGLGLGLVIVVLVLRIWSSLHRWRSVSWLFLLGCQYQCKWLTGKTHPGNDLRRVPTWTVVRAVPDDDACSPWRLRWSTRWSRWSGRPVNCAWRRLAELSLTLERCVDNNRQAVPAGPSFRRRRAVFFTYTSSTFSYNEVVIKALRETQTLRTGWSKAQPKVFAPPQTPFPGMQDGQHLISWRWSLPLPTDPVWWRSMHAISSYSGNRPTNQQTHKQTGPITIHCAAKLSAQCSTTLLSTSI